MGGQAEIPKSYCLSQKLGVSAFFVEVLVVRVRNSDVLLVGRGKMSLFIVSQLPVAMPDLITMQHKGGARMHQCSRELYLEDDIFLSHHDLLIPESETLVLAMGYIFQEGMRATTDRESQAATTGDTPGLGCRSF